MLVKSGLVALGSFVALAQATAIKRTPTEDKLGPLGKRASNTCLNANAVQTGSFVTGQQNDVPAAGQSNSATDTANFINFCSGSTLTNGLQIKTGSCNGIVMGKIPATTNMVSTVITNPKLNDNLPAETTFNVTLSVANLNLGTFTNATSTYYAAPQDIGSNGDIIGHTHVTIQNVGSSFQFDTPLDATQFVFFKGINDAGNGQGTVTTAVTGGLPAGNYRVCSMSSSANHQPVLMPVAQRGAQDDCRYFTVSGSGSGSGSTNNAATGGDAASSSAASPAAASSAASAASADTADTAASTAAAAATGTTAAAAGGKGKGRTFRGGSGKGRGGKTTAAAGATTAAAAAGTTASSVAGAAATSAAASSVAADAASTTAAAAAAASSTSTASASGAIGGIAAPPVTDSGDATRPFLVNGATFVNKGAAVQRSCAIQNNACANAVNSGQVKGFTVGDCNAQEEACNAQG